MSNPSKLITALVVFLGACFVYFAYIVYSAFSILGPWDKPAFEKMEWKALVVHYRFVNTKQDIQTKTFTFQGKELEDLKKYFRTKNSVGVSTGTAGFMLLTTNNREEWKFNFSTPEQLYCCKKSDPYYAYSITLEDVEFHRELRKLCWMNEQRNIPDVRLENIKVCTDGLGRLKEKHEPYGVLVHEVSSEPKPQVSDVISGENSEVEQIDTEKSIDGSDEK